MKIEVIHPDGWRAAKGYSNGMLVEGATRWLHVAGQVAWDAEQQLVGPGDFARQFEQALDNVVTTVRTAGGEPQHIVEMTVFVTDKAAYSACTRAIGEAWKRLVGRHYPAMALVEVAGLLETGALVEIQAVAAF